MLMHETNEASGVARPFYDFFDATCHFCADPSDARDADLAGLSVGLCGLARPRAVDNASK